MAFGKAQPSPNAIQSSLSLVLIIVFVEVWFPQREANWSKRKVNGL
jgi:hypothetical protein